MTPEARPHGGGEHPEVTELSDLAEGILPVARGREVRAHLEECSLCSDVHASLTEIRGALGSLPGPPRMPDDVAGRIDAALAAEALVDAERRRTEPGTVSRETAAADEPRAVSRETEPAATAEGASGASAGEAPARGPSRPAGAPRPAGHAPGRTGPGRTRGLVRHRRALLTAAGAVGALVLGGALLQSIAPDSPSSASGDASGESLLRQDEGGRVAGGDLEEQVHELLSQAPAAENAQPDLTVETESPDSAPLAGGPAVVPPCVSAGIDRPEQPLAAEPGRSYQGRPSYLVVLPHPGDPQRVDAYVVDSSCATEPRSDPAEVLLERTVPRD